MTTNKKRDYADSVGFAALLAGVVLSALLLRCETAEASPAPEEVRATYAAPTNCPENPGRLIPFELDEGCPAPTDGWFVAGRLGEIVAQAIESEGGEEFAWLAGTAAVTLGAFATCDGVKCSDELQWSLAGATLGTGLLFTYLFGTN